MDKAAYIERLETAIMKSSQAMAILREENTTLLDLNKKLQHRNSVLEEEVRGKFGNSKPSPSLPVILSSRNKRSFAGGIKLANPPLAVKSEVGGPLNEAAVKKARCKISPSSSKQVDMMNAHIVAAEQECKQEQEPPGEADDDMTQEELAVAKELDKDFDDLFNSSSESEEDDNDDKRNDIAIEDGDEMGVMPFGPDSESDSDTDDKAENCSETESTTGMAEEEVGGGDGASEGESCVTGVVSQPPRRVKEGGQGHESLDISNIGHPNLQILYVLEKLTMNNVHTASLLLCKFSATPVCETLCKHIKTVGIAEAERLREEEFSSGPGVGDRPFLTATPACSLFLHAVMALLASIAARVASNGPALCKKILNMMHDNLWFTWFPKDSATTTAGWKRQGMFCLQEQVFFGKKGELSEERRQAGNGDDSELICEMFSTILIHVGYQQNLIELVDAVLKSYAYVSPYKMSLGTAIGILNSLILNGGTLSVDTPSIRVDYTMEWLKLNSLVNNLLVKWNTSNMCILSEIIYHTVECNAEALTIKTRSGMMNLANVFRQYCLTCPSSLRDKLLTECHDGDMHSPIQRWGDHAQEASFSYLRFIKFSYTSQWSCAESELKMKNSPVVGTVNNVISKWQTDKSHERKRMSTGGDIGCQAVTLQDSRYGADMFLPYRLRSTGVWSRILHLEKSSTKSMTVFSSLGIVNVEVVISEVLSLHNHIKSLRNAEASAETNAFVAIFGEASMLRLCSDRISGDDSHAFSRPVNPTLAGVEVAALQTMSRNWIPQLELVLQEASNLNEGGVTEAEVEVIQRLHLVVSTLKCATVPLHFETAASFKNTNFEYILQDSVSTCKMLLLQQQIPLPALDVTGSRRASTTSNEQFSSTEMFQAVSVSPALMQSSVNMLNHCLLYLCDGMGTKSELFIESVSKLAANISQIVYEMLLFLVITSLRALLDACRLMFSYEAGGDIDKTHFHHPLIRISQECMMILLNCHHTSFFAFNKSYILCDIMKTIGCIGSCMGKEGASAAGNGARTLRREATMPLAISKWVWSQSYRKIPAVVINLDVREVRWKKMMSQCSQHGIFPVRMAAVDARKGHSSAYAERPGEGGRSVPSAGLIPAEVVSMTWDSTTNAKFDKRCLVNVATPMTPSERACAASHVMTWKLVYELFASKVDPSSELAKFLTSSQGGRGVSSKKNFLKPLPNLHVYDAIPDMWVSQPRPQYQKSLLGERARQDSVRNVCSLLSNRCHGNNSAFYGKYLLVLEDDAVFDPHPKLKGKNVHPYAKRLTKKDFLQRIKEIEDKIPADFDICYLGYTGKIFKKTVKKVLVRPQYVWQLHAYLLSPKGAARLLSHLPVSAPVDNFIAKLIVDKHLEAYAVPMDAQLVKQEGTFSFRQATSDIVHSSSGR